MSLVIKTNHTFCTFLVESAFSDAHKSSNREFSEQKRLCTFLSVNLIYSAVNWKIIHLNLNVNFQASALLKGWHVTRTAGTK